MAICIFGSIYYLIWFHASQYHLEYLSLSKNSITDTSPSFNFFLRFGNWMLIFTYIYFKYIYILIIIV